MSFLVRFDTAKIEIAEFEVDAEVLLRGDALKLAGHCGKVKWIVVSEGGWGDCSR